MHPIFGNILGVAAGDNTPFLSLTAPSTRPAGTKTIDGKGGKERGRLADEARGLSSPEVGGGSAREPAVLLYVYYVLRDFAQGLRPPLLSPFYLPGCLLVGVSW